MSAERQAKGHPHPGVPPVPHKKDRGGRGVGPPFRNSAETRTAILDAAEDLFSRHGVGAVSIRSINVAVGLAPAAVNYHFGTKDGLLGAVLRRRGEAALRRSNELLDALAASGRTPTAHDIINITAIPCREMLARDPVRGLRWIRLFAHLLLARNPRVTSRRSTVGLWARIWHVTCQAFPGVPQDVLALGSRLAINTFYQMLSDIEVPPAEGKTQGAISATYLNMVTEFVASGFAAAMAVDQGALTPTPRPLGEVSDA